MNETNECTQDMHEMHLFQQYKVKKQLHYKKDRSFQYCYYIIGTFA